MNAPMRCVVVPFSPDAGDSRARLRLQSLSWALTAAVMAAGVALLLTLATPQNAWLEPALRSGGCGFFYGLLAFHLQRVDPDDGHLQAGLVGAVCGICSLISPLQVTGGLSTAMMNALRGWLPLWLPLVGSALLLRVVHRLLPALRP
jgi:hypothetical protein